MPLEKRGKNQMNAKKIVLFIVEGMTEQTALSLVLSKLLEDTNVRFKIVRGDITSDSKTTVQNAITKVDKQVKEFLDRNREFKKKDIAKVVQLVDMDGAYIDPMYITQENVTNTVYSDSGIITSNKEDIIERNNRKSLILNKLSTTTKISSIPYEVYYFSNNREHVFHNDNSVLTKEQKIKYAYDFEGLFHGKEIEFISFIKSSEFAVEGDYIQSWNFIKTGMNSLKRYSNFHLFFQNV